MMSANNFEEHYLNCDIKNNCVLDLVCVYNNIDCYYNELLDSFKKQTTSFSVHLLAINNTKNFYLSAAQAFNAVSHRLKGKYVVFLHQDIRFNSITSLHNIITQILAMQSTDIFGYAGVVRGSRKTVLAYSSPVEVETIDECFFGMETTLFEQLQFNEELCCSWHMYAVEICLHNKCLGGRNYVINSDITHLSPGVVSIDYTKTLIKLISHYRKYGVASIWTTCAKFDLTRPYKVLIFIWTLKHEIVNKIIRPIRSKFS